MDDTVFSLGKQYVRRIIYDESGLYKPPTVMDNLSLCIKLIMKYSDDNTDAYQWMSEAHELLDQINK